MKKCFKMVIMVALAAALLVSCTISGFCRELIGPKLIRGNNWMSEVPNNAYLNALNIPGTHDSGMSNTSVGVGMFAQTQSLTIAQQLEAGARIFDIRLRYGGDDENYICHGEGIFNCDGYKPDDSHYTYWDVLKEMADFLIANPSETVLFFVRDEDPGSDEKDDYDYNHALATAEAKLEEYWKDSAEHEFIRYSRKAVPEYTMGEVRGDIIRFPDGVGFGDLMNERLYDNYEYSYVDKWNNLKPYFDSAPDQNLTESKRGIGSDFRAAYTSCTGQKTYDEDGNTVMNNLGITYSKILPTGGQEAEKLNPLLLKYPFENGAYYGWIGMDYLTSDLAQMIYGTNNYNGVREHIIPEKTYIKDITAFCDDDYDDAVEACYESGYTPLKGTKSNGKTFLNVNPDGDPIIIGYTLTTDPNGAITDIVGRYDDNEPGSYKKVLVHGSLFNYFTRWAGGDSKDTYLFVSRDNNHTPITELILLDHEEEGMTMASFDLDGDKPVGSNQPFNLQAGLSRFVGLGLIRDDAPGYATMFSAGNIMTIVICLAILLAAVIVLFRAKKMRDRPQTKDSNS